MSLPIQPPPDIEAPELDARQMDAVGLRVRPRREVIATFVLCGLVLLVFGLVSAPVVLKSKKSADRTEALNNARQVGLALFEFDTEYGRFPDASTIVEVRRATGTPLNLGDASSNQLLRQLLATGMKSEKPFYVREPGSRRPDDRFDTATNALEPGECGFAYVAGVNASDSPGTPVLLAPMIRGAFRFDPRALEEKAVILRLDNSATPHSLDSSGRAVIGGKGKLFDPHAPWWKRSPDLKWQE